MRVKAIDVFRGLSIVLMVFFSLTIRLSDGLPDPLTHNVSGSLHFGDFVLTMFIFASGMSLVFFHNKRKGKDAYIYDVIGRFGKLALTAFILSPFSAGEVLGMDEVMLSALLFLPSVLLVRYSERTIAAVAAVPIIIYLLLQHMAMLPDFTLHYLGGYPAALFYLPVMLGGVIAGKRLEDIWKLFAFSLVASIILLALVPPYKMSASPSFMALSVSLSLLFFALLRDVESGWLEYLGRRPFRYWVLMFGVLLIPLSIYAVFSGLGIPLPLDWMPAVALSVLSMILLYMVSKGIDILKAKAELQRRKAHI